MQHRHSDSGLAPVRTEDRLRDVRLSRFLRSEIFADYIESPVFLTPRQEEMIRRAIIRAGA